MKERRFLKAGVAGIAAAYRARMAVGQAFWFCVVLLSGASASAQAPHPRLWVTQTDLSHLRALASDTGAWPLGSTPAEAFAAVRGKADEYANEPAFVYRANMPGKGGGPAKEWIYTLSDEAPPKHDDYPHYPCWTGMSRQIETRIIHLSFAHLVTQDRSYFEKAKEAVLHLCRWPGTWTDPSYSNPGACLDTSHLSIAVALFYDWCYDQLTDDERALIRKSLVDKAVAGLLEAVPHYGAGDWPNGYAVLTSALGICGVTLQGEEQQAETWVVKAATCAKQFFDTQGKDGGCMEGPGYGTYGADALARFMLALESADVPHQLLEHPFFATLSAYCISQMCPNNKQHTGFGDCWPSQPFPLCMTLLALRGNADAVWYLHEIGYVKAWSIEQLLTIGLHAETFATPKPPRWNPSRAFVDIGYASLRDGFNADAAFMAFKAGPPTRVIGHNHRDHNSFQIHFNNVWIATDPGYVGYFDPPDNKYGRCTFGHNTICLDVDDEYLGEMSFPLLGHDQMRLNGGRLVGHASGPDFDYVKGEAADAYNPDDTGAKTQVHFWRPGQPNGFARISGPSPSSDEWQQYEVSGTAPDEAIDFCLALELGGASESVWYDDAEILVDGQKLDLPNPGFEDGTTHWNARNAPGEHVIDQQTAHSGRCSARITSPGGYYYWLPEGKRLPIKPGQKITARFWAKCTIPEPVMERADREILFIKPHVFVIRDTLVAPDPHAFSFVLHTLGGIEISGGNSAVLSAPGSARLETHVFSPSGITLGSSAFPGAEQRGPYLNAVTGKADSTVITSVLIARTAAFKLTNAGFEAGMVGWTPRGIPDWSKIHVIDDQVFHSGRKSGRLDSPGGYYYTPRFPVEPGTKVAVRFWAKLDGKADRHATVYWWHKDRLSGNGTGRELGPVISGNEWKQYEFAATVPSDVELACVALNYFGDGTIWYDDIDVSVDTKRKTMAPGRVTAVKNARQGVVIELDGLRHLVAFAEGETTLAGRKLSHDGKRACISLDAQGRPVAAWLLGGTELKLDGDAVSHQSAASAIQATGAVD